MDTMGKFGNFATSAYMGTLEPPRRSGIPK